MGGDGRLSRRAWGRVGALADRGVPQTVGEALVFLSKRAETTSVAIEKATGLRQPEVSIAMQELRRRRWVDKRDIKKEGKGRPVHAYRLSYAWSAILDQLDKDQQTKLERIEANRRKLKSYA